MSHSDSLAGWVKTLAQLKIDLDKQHWIWMQFTGLKDKNGKEIYEGDYLQHADGEVSVVEWLDGCFVVRHFWNKKKSDCDFIAAKNLFEIIGNIYENPELLK